MKAVCDAIRRRAVIQFHYRGERRTVEPYLHGRTRAGKEVLRAYQIGGASGTGRRFAWKLFDLALIEAPSPVKVTFSLRADYRERDRSVPTVHCRV